MRDKRSKKVIKKRKLKLKAILAFLVFIICFSLIVFYIMNINITNIYITGNQILTEGEIIKIAKIDNYPKSIKNSSKLIKERLEKNEYIKGVEVKKRGLLNEVYIKIEENKPLVFDNIKNKTILLDGEEVDKKYITPILTNEVPKDIYNKFLECMDKIDESVFVKISEIKYDPNDIDKERFYLTMNDGNYVYLTLNKFLSINNYINIVKTFNNKKGILYLDSGEYFEILE